MPEDVFPATHKQRMDQIRPISDGKVTRVGMFTIRSLRYRMEIKIGTITVSGPSMYLLWKQTKKVGFSMRFDPPTFDFLSTFRQQKFLIF